MKLLISFGLINRGVAMKFNYEIILLTIPLKVIDIIFTIVLLESRLYQEINPLGNSFFTILLGWIPLLLCIFLTWKSESIWIRRFLICNFIFGCSLIAYECSSMIYWVLK